MKSESIPLGARVTTTSVIRTKRLIIEAPASLIAVETKTIEGKDAHEEVTITLRPMPADPENVVTAVDLSLEVADGLEALARDTGTTPSQILSGLAAEYVTSKARLISATSDLLEAAKHAVRVLEKLEKEDLALFAQLTAAIAKAEGGPR
jgi:hypothetical protein